MVYIYTLARLDGTLYRDTYCSTYRGMCPNQTVRTAMRTAVCIVVRTDQLQEIWRSRSTVRIREPIATHTGASAMSEGRSETINFEKLDLMGQPFVKVDLTKNPILQYILMPSSGIGQKPHFP